MAIYRERSADLPRGAAVSAMLLLLVAAAPEPRPGRCTPATTTRVLVQVNGLKSGVGTVRVQAYREDGFLEKGRGVARVEEEPAGRTSLTVCLAVPGPGRYAVAVRHDANANHKSDWNDGGGFSGDPSLSLLRLRPSFAATATELRPGVNRLAVTMQYRRGLSIGPL